jgi:nucleoside-diphosphate-sugar epimerase
MSVTDIEERRSAMRVVVTGASGWIGTAAVDELLGAGHEVVGLARTDAAAQALAATGAEALRGDLDDLQVLQRGAAGAHGVVHLANKHDWANPAESDRAERAAVETLAGALVGSSRPLVLASGVAGVAPGRPALESDVNPAVGPGSPRGGSENLALDHIARGVRAVPVRFAPTVHAAGDGGFVAALVAAARSTGVSAYVGDGSNAWAAVHRADAARLVRLGLERAHAGAVLHAVAEEGVPTRAIAEAIGTVLGLPVTSVDPEDAVAHFGFVGQFFAADFRAAGTATQEAFGWTPTGPTLVEDILAGAYTGG